jgi:hypothetical protein
MPKVYSVEILVCGTAYILAESEAEAAAKAQEAFEKSSDASVSSRTTFGEVPVSGYAFDGDMIADDLPEISLSPALTFCGAASVLDKLNPADITADSLECVYDPADAAEERAEELGYTSDDWLLVLDGRGPIVGFDLDGDSVVARVDYEESGQIVRVDLSGEPTRVTQFTG